MSRSDNTTVIDFQKAKDKYLTSKEGTYLSEYLKELKAQTVVIEYNYIDKDYIIDYSKFYARSFRDYERFTKRLHFFQGEFSKNEFIEMIVSYNENKLNELKEKYLGFVVIKPIPNNRGKPLIGRTIIKTYPRKSNGDKRYFLTQTCHSSLYGVPLEIETLPYKTQDIAAGACATTAIWVSLYPLNNLFNIPLYSSYEITEKSITLPSTFRSFPSEGLSFWQMINFIKTLRLDTEIINIDNVPLVEKDSLISAAIKAYLNCGLPIIASLCMKNENDDYHAVVISGYKIDSCDNVKEIYVHDDQIGPYSKAIPKNNLSEWENEWTTKYEYNELIVNTLLIPVYPKMRLTFIKIYRYFNMIKNLYADYDVNLLLEQINSYKKFILENSVKDKKELLFSPMPRFLWIIRISFSGKPKLDIVLDGTSVFPRPIKLIDFEYSF